MGGQDTASRAGPQETLPCLGVEPGGLNVQHAHQAGDADRNDAEAIKDTCSYVARVLQNLNSHVGSYNSEVTGYVHNLNNQLRALLLAEQPMQHSLGCVGKKQPAEPAEHEASGGMSQAIPGPSNLGATAQGRDAKRQLTFEAGTQTPQQTVHPIPEPGYVSWPRTHAALNSARNFAQRSGGEESESNSDTEAEEPGIQLHSTQDGPLRFRSEREPLSHEDLLRAISRLDMRSVPKPGVYDSSTGQSFRQFLHTFEEYCQNTFRGSSSLWIGELGRFLKGEMLQAFNALQVSGDSYDTIKRKLLQWQKDSKESFEANAKEKFATATKLPTESLRLYAARLEKSFRLAFPRRQTEQSATLRDKYFKSIPLEFQLQLQSARSIALTMNGTEMTWTNILALASRFDAQRTDFTKMQASGEIYSNREESHGFNDRPVKPGPVTFYAESSEPRVYQVSTPQRVSRSQGRYTDSHDRSITTPGLYRQQKSATGYQEPTVQPGHRARSQTRPGKCSYCRKEGHVDKDCWKRRGCCLVCGSESHRIANCPKRRSYDGAKDSYYSSNPARAQSTSGNA